MPCQKKNSRTRDYFMLDNLSNLNMCVLIFLHLEVVGDKFASSNRIGLCARGVALF
jgi:hypothetical protein